MGKKNSHLLCLYLIVFVFFFSAHSMVNDDEKQDEYLAQLSAVISDVYKKIFNESPVTSDPLKNLASIENRLEELFQAIDLMDSERLKEAEKAR